MESYQLYNKKEEQTMRTRKTLALTLVLALILSMLAFLPANAADANDSSDLPDWTGKQLTLCVWNGHGTGDARRIMAPNDVVSPEIERLFGIKLDGENSFDNGGMDITSKLAVLAATNEFPELGYNVINDDLIQAGKLWDLTDLIPVYCPNIYAQMLKDAPGTLAKGYNNTGRLYGVHMNVGNNATDIQKMYPDADMVRYASIAVPQDRHGDLSCIWVRDDILKLMYPEAKTQQEIEDLYVQNGAFTREEIYDVPLTSRQDVVDFFYLMKQVIDENNITEDGKPVYPTYVNDGGDNWALMAWLRNMMDGRISFNYFTYFDLTKQTIELGYMQDWFKEDVRTFSQFVRDGVASESCLIENNEIFWDRLNNGEYAVSYAWNIPDAAKLQAAGKPYQFRKVYFDIPQDTGAILVQGSEVKGYDTISIFKDKVAEEDLPQILSWLDFMYTDLGQKLVSWGPRTAGLWEEVDGVRRFTNAEVEANLVYNEENGANERYNLAVSRTTLTDFTKCPAYPSMYVGIQGGGLNAPRFVYDLSQEERVGSGANTVFASGIFDAHLKSPKPIVTSCDIWSYTNEIESVKRFWDVRGSGFEPLLTKCLAARNDEEFEKAYQDMIDFAELNGMTAEALAECEELMKTQYTEDWETYMAGYAQ